MYSVRKDEHREYIVRSLWGIDDITHYRWADPALSHVVADELFHWIRVDDSMIWRMPSPEVLKVIEDNLTRDAIDTKLFVDAL